MTGAVLVVGGTAILRPAVVALRAAGRVVAVLSRSRDRLVALPAGTAGVVGDLADPAGLAPVLAAPGHLSAGLAYLPDAAGAEGVPALAVLRAAVDGPLVVILTTAAAAAGPERPVDLDAIAANLRRRLVAAGDLRLLLLGWRPMRTGAPARWHTPAEISAAALECLDDPTPRLLGVVRPWTDRPG